MRFFENHIFSMNKTLHRKLTGKHLYDHTPAMTYTGGDDWQLGLAYEVNLLREAAKDLMQPRPEAIANILKLAKSI